MRKEVENDATVFVRAVDLESLPPDATLMTLDVIPLVYTQAVMGVRPAVDVLLHHGRLNRAFVESVDGRVFTTRPVPPDLRAELFGESLAKEIFIPKPSIVAD